MREYLSRHEFAKTGGFRWRAAGEISRIEGFSDSVFAFAVTLLVISLEVPKTFGELVESMRGFAAFAAAFAILFMIWLNQYRFFRRYGLQDGVTLWLNALLLFLVLFFVYPLKFCFSFLFNIWTGGRNEVTLPNGEVTAIMRSGQGSQLMMIYAAGYAAIFLLFLMLYWRAYSKREALELSQPEIFETTNTIEEMAVQILIGSISLGFAAAGQAGWAGLTYVLIGPLLTMHGFWSRRRRRILIGA